MRYEVRFCNGFWQVFDTDAYVGLDTFGLKGHALEACYWANETGQWRPSHWACKWSRVLH